MKSTGTVSIATAILYGDFIAVNATHSCPASANEEGWVVTLRTNGFSFAAWRVREIAEEVAIRLSELPYDWSRVPVDPEGAEGYFAQNVDDPDVQTIRRIVFPLFAEGV
jgi:hypothetical protein